MVGGDGGGGERARVRAEEEEVAAPRRAALGRRSDEKFLRLALRAAKPAAAVAAARRPVVELDIELLGHLALVSVHQVAGAAVDVDDGRRAVVDDERDVVQRRGRRVEDGYDCARVMGGVG